jgi:CheY-like chemotaxis protein
VRVLIVENNEADVLLMRRALAGRYDVRWAGTFAQALRALAEPSWRADIIVLGPDLPDSRGPATLEALQRAAAGTPVILRADGAAETLRQRLDALGADLDERERGFVLLRAVLQQHQVIHQTLAANRAEVTAEIERAAQRAAEIAVRQAIDQLMARLGLGDEEGVRMAVRLARGWEAAKSRFFATIATGIASALLLALGAGIIAMVRQSGER